MIFLGHSPAKAFCCGPKKKRMIKIKKITTVLFHNIKNIIIFYRSLHCIEESGKIKDVLLLLHFPKLNYDNYQPNKPAAWSWKNSS